MKIILISNLYPPYVQGGGEIVVHRTAELLQKHLQHVTVITTIPYAGFRSFRSEQVRINNVPTYRFFPLNIYHYIFGSRFPYIIRSVWNCIDALNIHSYFVVKGILKKEKPDIVITHNLKGIGFLIPKAIASLGMRHIHVIHDVQLYDPSGIMKSEKDSARHKIYRLIGYHALMRFAFSKVQLLLSPSQFLINFYTQRGFFKNVRSRVLKNPVPDVQINIPISDTVIRFIYIGKISKEKGVDVLLQAVSRITDKQFILDIVGSGPLLASLRATNRNENIKFHGWKPQSEVLVALSQASVLILPSTIIENSPSVITEAQRAGVAVIASNIGGIPELVQNKKNGWLVEPANVDSLEHALRDVLNNPELIQKFGLEGKRLVSESLPDGYIRRLLDIIERETQ